MKYLYVAIYHYKETSRVKEAVIIEATDQENAVKMWRERYNKNSFVLESIIPLYEPEFWYKRKIIQVFEHN